MLADTVSDILVIRQGKGCESKIQPIPNIATYSLHRKRDLMMLSDSQELFLALGRVLDHELMLLSMFPEVFFVDVTCKTKKEGHGLSAKAGKNGNSCGFTEQCWVFD